MTLFIHLFDLIIYFSHIYYRQIAKLEMQQIFRVLFHTCMFAVHTDNIYIIYKLHYCLLF